MDVAVPTNMRVGLAQNVVAEKGWALSAEQVKGSLGRPESLSSTFARIKSAGRRLSRVAACSLSSAGEGIPGRWSASTAGERYGQEARFLLRLRRAIRDGRASRSKAQALTHSRHMQGGLQAWKSVGGSLRKLHHLGGGWRPSASRRPRAATSRFWLSAMAAQQSPSGPCPRASPDNTSVPLASSGSDVTAGPGQNPERPQPIPKMLGPMTGVYRAVSQPEVETDPREED